MNNNLEQSISNRTRYYKEPLPIFEEMILSCNDEYQLSQMYDVMRNLHMMHMSSHGINSNIPNQRGTILFDENNTNKKKQKRYEFTHETI